VISDCGPPSSTPPLDEVVDAVCEVTGTLTEPIFSGTECSDPSLVGGAPQPDYFLAVDPEYSYLTVHAPGGQDTVALSGLGGATSDPEGFVWALVDLDDGSIGSTAFSSWTFWFTEPIEIDVVDGDVTVPHEQAYAVLGGGQQGSHWENAVFEPTVDATGNLGSTWWDLDYTSTFSGGWIAVHLEGAVTTP
jgi:hypothetical protein